MSLRTSLENLLKIHKIEMQDHFIQTLNEITKAGLPGKDLLLDMIQTASTESDLVFLCHNLDTHCESACLIVHICCIAYETSHH